MSVSDIAGVAVRTLVRHKDDRGSLTELIRSDWPEFRAFGQAILTVNQPGIVRGWHWHDRQTDVIVVIQGEVRVGLYDARAGSPTHGRAEAHQLDGDELRAIFVPPGVWHGYATTGRSPALIVNVPDRVYDAAHPDEGRAAHDDARVAFDWGVSR